MWYNKNMTNNNTKGKTMKNFNVTILSPRTGREETHMYIGRDRLYQNEDGETFVNIYNNAPSEVIMTEEVIPPTWEAVTCNGRFSCE